MENLPYPHGHIERRQSDSAKSAWACCASTMRALPPYVESALEAGYRHIDGAAGYEQMRPAWSRAEQMREFTEGEQRKKPSGLRRN